MFDSALRRLTLLGICLGLILLGASLLRQAVLAQPQGGTNVSGTISTNTTWTLANSPYIMTSDLTVASGAILRNGD